MTEVRRSSCWRIPPAVILLGALAARQAVAQCPLGGVGPSCRETVVVNVNSFLSGGSSVDPNMTSFAIERMVRGSVAAWNQFGSVRRGFQFLGTTTEVGCPQTAQHLVQGVPGICLNECDCSNPNSAFTCVSGVNYSCPGGKSYSALNTHAAQSSINRTIAYPGAMQAVLTHELGHVLVGPTGNAGNHLADVPGNEPMMRAGSFPSTIELSQGDILAATAHSGLAVDNVQRLRAPGWTSPQTAAASFAFVDFLPSQWGTLDLAEGFLTYAGGTPTATAFVVENWGILALARDYSSGSAAVANAGVTRRVTSFYDKVHAQWWLFVLEADNSIGVLRSSDQVQWTFLGLLSRPGLGPSGGPIVVRSRFPPAVTQDLTRGQSGGATSSVLVVAYTNFSRDFTRLCLSSVAFCSQELHVIAIPWNATSAVAAPGFFTRFPRPQPVLPPGAGFVPPNVTACVGPPAIACSPFADTCSGRGPNCEVLCTGFDYDRPIVTTPVWAGSTGVFPRSGTSGGQYRTGGWTDHPISFETSFSGHLNAAIAGLDDSVWLATKPAAGPCRWAAPSHSPAATEGPWVRLPGPITSFKGPLLRSKLSPFFDLVVFP
jgi:hypothetical protein